MLKHLNNIRKHFVEPVPDHRTCSTTFETPAGPRSGVKFSMALRVHGRGCVTMGFYGIGQGLYDCFTDIEGFYRGPNEQQ